MPATTRLRTSLSTPLRSSLGAPLGTVAATTLLSCLLVGCGGEVEIGESTTTVTSPSATAPAATPGATGSASPADVNLAPQSSTVGRVQLRLPAGWAALEGSDMASSGETSTTQGGFRATSVPAQGRTAEQWIEDLEADRTDLFDEEGGMEALEPVTTASGLTLFHLVQSYSENRAHVFGTVVGDTLHLLRFGLDGSEPAVEVARASAATFTPAP